MVCDCPSTCRERVLIGALVTLEGEPAADLSAEANEGGDGEDDALLFDRQ